MVELNNKREIRCILLFRQIFFNLNLLFLTLRNGNRCKDDEIVGDFNSRLGYKPTQSLIIPHDLPHHL